MQPAHSESLYSILGIQLSASVEQIRKAYKAKALETHPDRLGPNATELRKQIAQARFQKIHEAFAILSDPHKRKAYDNQQPSLTKSEQSPGSASNAQLQRMKDRMEWAQKQQKLHQERINAVRTKNKHVQDELEAKEKLTKMTNEYLQELFTLNPEWEERKRRVLEQKARHAKTGSRKYLVDH
ncbi:hypothetical protein AMATHDRAFT_2641 [Amanita thiersii Skay4041]|uniref:J domain-containing protein n=1 Tax=Amanita thiersii Skay4041 TaxID=703135 RepID=A0A2A9NRH8_9AGAR|nr:hypothetical protein AMATHDRAFT_2641 [Amanita thiersii Skay4041]